ncbi:hypothetical protein BDZ90DRAFT_233936 [Jaminaea rosea]|uniref:Citrate transporter-like domain-containing protein n=1 Tax=Jaminaea rosea TaxID=1569628 RepID=A0A316UQT1_9BASI|nr:hypothetical protein BDZ90DRAFT_233936 [Jaminaea rosea]PWN25485.1 hypothetical protein BDZ90DRAFT_233936 [Jaminaea rosea]
MEAAQAASIVRRAPSNPTAGQGASLNGHGIFAIVVFAIVMFVVIQPLRIPVPFAVSDWTRAKWRKLNPPVHDEQEQHTVTDNAATPPAGPDPPSRPASLMSEHQVVDHGTRRDRVYLNLNHVNAPIVGILFLLATKTIGGEQIKLGIVGDGHVEPYDTLLLFLSLAYIAISLDTTGLLRFLAFHVSISGGRSGPRLFYSLYGFFFFLGLLVGNDAVVLSGTSFLVYFTRIAGISPPDAWIWAQFAAANIASATLVSSNLTNVVVATGFGIKFTTYSAFMALPTVASGVVAIFCIRVLFINRQPRDNPFKKIVKKLREPTMTTNGGARVKPGVALPSLPRRRSTMSRTSHVESLKKVAGGKATPVEEEEERGVEAQTGVASASAGPSSAGRSSATASVAARSHREQASDSDDDSPSPAARQIVFMPPYMIPPDVNPRSALNDPFGAIWGSAVMAITLGVLVGTSVLGTVKVYQVSLPGAFLCLARDFFKDVKDWRAERLRKQREGDCPGGREAGRCEPDGRPCEAIELEQVAAVAKEQEATTPSRGRPRPNVLQRIMALPHCIARVLPTVTHVCARLPLPLLPFAFGMFILDESLAHVGFITIMARGLGKVCAGGELGTAFFIGMLSVVLCCFGGTNIGACILLVRSFQDAAFQGQLPALPTGEAESITRVALYSLALGSNVGALGGTFAASLAGLLWRGSLRHGGITVKPSNFFLWSAATMPLSLAAGVVVVWAQVKSGKWPM